MLLLLNFWWHVCGSLINWLCLLLRYLASLYDAACMLLITGLMGLPSLRIFIKALSFGVMRPICTKYFCWFFLLLCYICVLVVGLVFEMFPWDLHSVPLLDSLV